MKQVILLFLGLMLNLAAHSQWHTVTATSGLRVRDQPSLEGNRLTSLAHRFPVYVLERSSETLTVDGRTAPWAKIGFHDTASNTWKEGWAFSGFLAALEERPNAERAWPSLAGRWVSVPKAPNEPVKRLTIDRDGFDFDAHRSSTSPIFGFEFDDIHRAVQRYSTGVGDGRMMEDSYSEQPGSLRPLDPSMMADFLEFHYFSSNYMILSLHETKIHDAGPVFTERLFVRVRNP